MKRRSPRGARLVDYPCRLQFPKLLSCNSLLVGRQKAGLCIERRASSCNRMRGEFHARICIKFCFTLRGIAGCFVARSSRGLGAPAGGSTGITQNLPGRNFLSAMFILASVWSGGVPARTGANIFCRLGDAAPQGGRDINFIAILRGILLVNFLLPCRNYSSAGGVLPTGSGGVPARWGYCSRAVAIGGSSPPRRCCVPQPCMTDVSSNESYRPEGSAT